MTLNTKIELNGKDISDNVEISEIQIDDNKNDVKIPEDQSVMVSLGSVTRAPFKPNRKQRRAARHKIRKSTKYINVKKRKVLSPAVHSRSLWGYGEKDN